MLVETDNEVITIRATELKADEYHFEIIISDAVGAESTIQWIREQRSTSNMEFYSTTSA